MKNGILFSAILSLALATAGLSGCATKNSYVDLYGLPAPISSAVDRTIRITPETKYVNVEGGQTVAFIVGDKKFDWNFAVATTVNAFPLNEVAPAGVLDHPVVAYVSPDPKYIGGGDGGSGMR